MILCINRYENYTRAFNSSLQTSGKVLKRCYYQMIRYWILSIWSSKARQWLFLHYRYSPRFASDASLFLLMRTKCVGPRCMINLIHMYSYNQKKVKFTKNQKVWLCCRGDLTSLFFSKVAKYTEVKGDLSSDVENKKSFSSRPSDGKNYVLA